MDNMEWQARRESVADDIHNLLFEEAGCGPFDGGCVAVAIALQQVIGGEIVVLLRKHSETADHAAVLFDEMLWDFDGPLSPFEFMKRFQENELSITGQECGGYRAITEDDLEEAYRNDHLSDRLADYFRIMLTGYGVLVKP